MPKKFWDMTIQAPIVEQATCYVSEGKALDIGAGEGRNAIYLAQKGFEVYAIDPDKDALEKIDERRASEGVTIITSVGTIDDLDTNSAYDFIVCNMVLHFLRSRAEVTRAVSRMKQITRPNGINVIAAYTDKNEPNKRPYLFAHNELRDMYQDWQIKYYTEKPTLWFQMPYEDKPRRNHAVYLIAQKRYN